MHIGCLPKRLSTGDYNTLTIEASQTEQLKSSEVIIYDCEECINPTLSTCVACLKYSEGLVMNAVMIEDKNE